MSSSTFSPTQNTLQAAAGIKETERSEIHVKGKKKITCGGWQAKLSSGKSPKPVLAWTWSLEIPPPSDGYVRVRLVAAGISPLDCALISFENNGCYPCGVGVEGAGIVESIGSGYEHSYGTSPHSPSLAVSSLHPGAPVVVLATDAKNVLENKTGTFCHYINVEVSRVVKIPQSTSCLQAGDSATPLVSFVDAATIPVTGVSAYLVLKENFHIEKGRSIYIHGASGGTGSVMVQLAHHFGLYVIASCSTVHHDYVCSLGADLVFDYSTAKSIVPTILESTNGFGVDYAVDCSNGEETEDLADSLRFGGSLCVLSNGSKTHSNFFGAWHRQLSFHYISLLNFLQTTRGLAQWRKAVEEMLTLYISGIIEVFVEEVPLNHASVALDVLRREHVMGKLVLVHYDGSTEKGGAHFSSTYRATRRKHTQKVIQ